MDKAPEIFRKSWTAYLGNFLALCVWIALFWLFLSYEATLRQEVTRQLGPQITQWTFLGIKVFFTLAILRRLWHFLWLRSYRVSIGNDHVAVQAGILPWSKFYRAWDSDQVHECLVDTGGFIGWLTKAGNVQLVGSEGVAHKYWMPQIGRAERCCGAINAMRRRARADLHVALRGH